MRAMAWRRLMLAAWMTANSLGALACGGTPTGPGPTPPPPPANAAPVIEGIAIEPARVEVGAEVMVTATVRDAETPAAQLQYQWSASGGSFSGAGAVVTWRAPATLSAPEDFVLTLTLVEPLAGGGQHRVTAGSPPVRVHDSPRELAELAVAFLTDFANSAVAPEIVVRDFWEGCPGRRAELEDVRDNRHYYENLGSQLGTPRVTLDAARLRADLTVSCQFTARAKSCPPDEPLCIPGAVGTAVGECRLTGVYEQRRWWLCDSTFHAPAGQLMPRFFGR